MNDGLQNKKERNEPMTQRKTSMLNKLLRLCLIAVLLAVTAGGARATETENLGIHVLPAAKPPAIDGSLTGWDLSGGVFACGDVENTREQYSVWFHAMYDAENLYLLARWNDPTPLNNPGQTIANFGWEGDCLQVRLIMKDKESAFNCWKGADGKDVVQGYPKEAKVVVPAGIDMKPDGIQQAFKVDADGKGYAQVITIPWKLLTPDKAPLKAGDIFTMNIEPNFTVGKKGRWSIKDIFKPGITPDRVFTFMSKTCWGPAWLEAKGNLTPRPVRLAGAREFPVKLEKGVPVVDWTGLIVAREIKG